jgi:hypothetical protein
VLCFKQNIVFDIIRIMDFAILIWPSQNSNRQINFIKFSLLKEEFFHSEGQKGTTDLITTFRNFAKASQRHSG